MKKTLVFVCILFFGLQENAYAGDDEIQFNVSIKKVNNELVTEITPISPVPKTSKLKKGSMGSKAGRTPLPTDATEAVDLTVYILPAELDDPCVRVGNGLVCW